MDQRNETTFNYFIIIGITEVPEFQVLVFFLFLLIYLLTLTGNMIIFLLICLDRELHHPMYFFLGNLSILDISCSTIALHKILAMFVTRNNIVSFPVCMAQIYFFSSLTCIELLILTAMSYDRYVAICNPLHYVRVIMNPQTCVVLALVCWVVGFIELIPYLVLLLRISCYTSNIINHFYCDMIPIIKLSCSDTSALELLIFTEGIFILSVTPLLLTLMSYVFIILSIMKIRSSPGRKKTFYTCSSHLTVVILLYGTLLCQYLRPSMDTLESNKIFSLFNTAAVPVLNPIIYSLKNKTVKSALKRRRLLHF